MCVVLTVEPPNADNFGIMGVVLFNEVKCLISM